MPCELSEKRKFDIPHQEHRTCDYSDRYKFLIVSLHKEYSMNEKLFVFSEKTVKLSFITFIITYFIKYYYLFNFSTQITLSTY